MRAEQRPHRRFLTPVIVSVVVVFGACTERDPEQFTGPSIRRAAAQDPSQGRALERFPEMREFLPAVRIVTASDPLPPELSDAELMVAVARASGQVIIGLKPATAPRTRETGEVPAIDRATALAARATVQALGAELTKSYRHSSAVAATIAPELAPVLRRLEVVDYVEASFPAMLMQSTQPQDTSWGVKRISAHHVWSGVYGPATRGEGVFVTIIDGGIDSVHRWSALGDGPQNLFLDCYWIEGSGSSCYDDRQPTSARGHGAHVAGIIASRDNAYGYIGIANNPQRFASIKVCDSLGSCQASWVADALDWILGESHPRRIVNMSLGWCENYTLVGQMTAQLSSAGVVVVASAGNHISGGTLAVACPNGQQNHLGSEWATGVINPARHSWVMAVSGSLEDDAFAAAPPPPGGEPPPGCGEGDMCGVPPGCTIGSRYGPQVEIAAPFWAYSMKADGLYGPRCGTSMSAPVVSAVASLVWSRNPGWTATQVRDRLRATAIPYSPVSQFGSGRVDAHNAVYAAPPPPPPPPTLSVGLSGYSVVQPYVQCRWFATVSGGTQPYTYEWEVDGQAVGDGSSALTYVNNGAPFTVSVVVGDAGGLTGSNTMSVTVSGSASECLDQ